MISFALLNCILETPEEKLEVRIVDCSVFHFLVRTAKPLSQVNQVTFHFYLNQNYVSCSLTCDSYYLEEQDEFAYYYRFETQDENYRHNIAALMKEIHLYTEMKLEERQEELVGFSLEENYPASSKDFFIEQFSSICATEKLNQFYDSLNIGYCLDHDEKRERYLKGNIQQCFYSSLTETGLANHPISKAVVTRIYVGNQFCFELFPKKEELLQILAKAQQEKLDVVMMFPPIREHEVAKMKAIVALLENRVSELIINDWGMMAYLQNRNFHLTFGVLMNKHLKDARSNTLTEAQKLFLYQTDIHTDFYQNFLKKVQIEKIAYDGKLDEINQPSEVFFPLTQMNTAGFCTLAAMMKHHHRGLQEDNLNCPHYCAHQAFLYPNQYAMIGLQNCIFEIDKSLLMDESAVERLQHCFPVFNL